jgi:hypothetical protein
LREEQQITLQKCVNIAEFPAGINQLVEMQRQREPSKEITKDILKDKKKNNGNKNAKNNQLRQKYSKN